MVVAQLGKKESLRELETCIRGLSGLLYHSGLAGKLSRNTLAYANETRSSMIFADFCRMLIKRVRKLYANDQSIKDFEGLVYILDSTLIALSLSVCPWSYFGSRPEAGIKVHTQLDLKGRIPSFIYISKAKMTDNYFLDHINVEPGAFYVMDRGYVDLPRLHNIHKRLGFFVIRSKWHIKFKRIVSRKKDENSSTIMSDQIGRFSGGKGKYNYPEQIRKIRFKDMENQRTFTFLTNNFDLSANVIADMYKARWQIELFFKWIKQNLKITSFFGHSQNAIETQIWTAVASYLMVAMAKKSFLISASLTEIVTLLPQLIFLKTPINKPFNDFAFIGPRKNEENRPNQLNLF
jgi:hypothetical protein